jgi:hypothetical protein
MACSSVPVCGCECIYLFGFLCLYVCMRVYVCMCRWVAYVSVYMGTCVNF